MKNVIKKFISCSICCVLFGMSTSFQIPADAKVIEPEIVKTETWTTSYFIDNDVETLYPYVQCEANIYNDGVIEVSYGNTYEWTGFATVSHLVTLINTEPYSTDSMEYAFKTGNTYTNHVGGTFKTLYNFDNIDLSFYPKEYQYTYGTRNNSWGNCGTGVIGSYDSTIEHFDIILLTSNYRYTFSKDGYIRHDSYRGSLPYLSVDKKVFITFTPMVDPTSTYHFRLYGHDITITPELLSGDIVAEPVLTEQEKYILELEEQNKYLTEQLNNYKYVDVDKDDMITAVDAQVMLQYYVASLVGKYSGRVEDYGNYVGKTVKTDS